MKHNFENIYQWYQRRDVKFEIIKQLYRREFALLIPSWVKDKKMLKTSTRNLKCHNTQHIDFILRALSYKYKHQPYNFYKSLALYSNGVPDQTMNFSKRDNKEWNQNHYKEMISYDFLVDIDIKSHDEFNYAYMSARSVIDLFQSCNTPFTLRFSGRGFHFEIPYPYLPKFNFDIRSDKNIFMFCSELGHAIKDRCSELVDAGIYDSRRLCKLNYSLAIYEDDIFVCYPINMMWQFEDFHLEEYNLKNFDKPVARRGQITFNPYGDIRPLLKNLGVDVE